MKIFNTLTKKKEEFIPLNEGLVNMYVCGPTVYNFFHIGNARTFLVFDTVRRYLEYKGYKVNYVQNFTDIDDKMIKRASKENTTVKELGDRYIDEFYKDANSLNIKPATKNPRATQFMDEMIDFIKDLIDKDYAYVVEGDVYFSTKKFKDYGKLWGQNLDDLMIGSRINVDERKKDPTDFALWKSAKIDEPYWTAPWGKGRPGWHIECSCMAHEILGETIDIHAGGKDLIFPHHVNEIAQSESKSGKTFAKYWMHAAYLNINNEKMSKSLNNFFTTREILERYDAEVVRLFMVSGHYRTPLNFSMDLLDSSKSALERMYNAVNSLENLLNEAEIQSLKEDEKGLRKSIIDYKNRFIEKMDDDFNTADAVSIIFGMIKKVNINVSIKSSKELIALALENIREMGSVLGILQKRSDTIIDEDIEALIEERQQARKNRDFALADSIRDELKKQGIILLDTPNGVRWSKK